MYLHYRKGFGCNRRSFITIVSLTAIAAVACITTPGVGAPAQAAVDVQLLDATPEHVVLTYQINDYSADAVMINGKKYTEIKLGKESPMKIAGAPALPNVCRSIVIPDDAEMQVNVLSSKYIELTGVSVAPSKGYILRTVNPKDVPYTFGDVYKTDAMFPGELATLREPYIMRDVRGVVVVISPFQYNPVTGTLRVYTNITVEVVPAGVGMVNVFSRPASKSATVDVFRQIYSRHFVNYGRGLRYTPLSESGDMLIIAHDDWIPNVQPLADHKNARGIDTTIVGVSSIGNSNAVIKNYIQAAYDAGDLAFVLLVGDYTQVDTPFASGGASDPSYALLAGSDHYPDILVGRFSAETAAQVDTQVQRTIEYENMPATAQDWFKKATGVASNEGPGDDGEYDYQHLNNIRTDLLGYGYTTVDQIYAPSGTATQITQALNAGRGFVNYTGHGGTTYWVTTGFSNTHVNALENDNMLPFIFDVACVNGDFDGPTCFAEAWMRATNGGEPTGAIAIYASSINQSWDPPMCAQDAATDLFVAEAYSTYGALCFAASCQMMDEYPPGHPEGAGIEMFDTWHLFGDPSLTVVYSCTDMGEIEFCGTKYGCESQVNISINDCGLNVDNGTVESVEVTIHSDSEPDGESVTLYETGPGTATFEGSIVLSESDSAGVLLVANGDVVTGTYIDADDGQGGTGVVVTTDVAVDCQPPQISNVRAVEVGTRTATVTFDSDEPSNGRVYYGESCGELTNQAMTTAFSLTPQVNLIGLQSETTYLYTVEAKDEAGNSATDDNGGSCYSFVTPPVPDYFTESFSDLDNDLDNLSFKFVPNGTFEFYSACVEPISELPTDPAGGIPLSMTDDGVSMLSPSGGEVSLYGTAYSSFYVASNGFITFTESDDDYSETLTEHFNLPRISALFDDLNPEQGGQISWKELADRVVVTWDAVTEFNGGNINTFQVEMSFDGQIQINYLTIDMEDGLAGLSKGEGFSSDFVETDLSNLGGCELRPPAFAPAPHNARKNRYISVVPNNPGMEVAFQVEVASMRRCSDNLARSCSIDADCTAPDAGQCVEHPSVGHTGWISEPFDPSCQSEPGDTPVGACAGTDYLARVVNSPVLRFWPEPLLQVNDCEIVPVASFALRATIDAIEFSDALVVGTITKPGPQHYGDTVGENLGNEFTAPQGVVNVTDVQGFLAASEGWPGAPHPSWVDLHGLGEGCVPNFILNISDLQLILFGLEGECYTDSPQNKIPSGCP
ncbi:MAG: hypothetical protein JSU63_18455 [Phycisphaerales bacterium]|nr:MAG: hypothetical protein JSU63_18455 [Phycisphaerales bacterium]